MPNSSGCVSLLPQESTATAANKTKGQLCKAVSGPVASTAKAVDANWWGQQARLRVVFDKFSFLPDHEHIAVEAHPTVSPALLVTELMNASQEFAFENFPENVRVGPMPNDPLGKPAGFQGRRKTYCRSTFKPNGLRTCEIPTARRF